MRIIRKRRRHNPKLAKATIQKIARRERKIEKLRARGSSFVIDHKIAGIDKEILLMIETDELIFDETKRRRDAAIAKERARPPRIDMRTREGRALKAARERAGTYSSARVPAAPSRWSPPPGHVYASNGPAYYGRAFAVGERHVLPWDIDAALAYYDPSRWLVEESGTGSAVTRTAVDAEIMPLAPTARPLAASVVITAVAPADDLDAIRAAIRAEAELAGVTDLAPDAPTTVS